MRYEDLDLVISGQGQRVEIPRSPIGTSDPIAFDPASLADLDGLLDGALEQLILAPDISVQAPRETLPGRALLRDVGERLFQATLGAWGQLPLARQTSEEQGTGIRLRIRCEDPGLAALPWELLYDRAGATYLALSERINLTRDIARIAPLRPLSVTPPLRILFCGASPSDQDPINVDEELQGMVHALAPLQQAGLVYIARVEGRFAELERALESEGPWHILHFTGHGQFVPGAGGFVLFENEDQTSNPIDSEMLARALGNHDPLRMTVLNSCRTAMADRRRGAMATAETIIRNDVAAAVTMQVSITNQAGAIFAGSFYGEMIRSGDVDSALNEAREALSRSPVANPDNPQTGHRSMEWSTPVVYLRSADGQVFSSQSPSPEAAPAPGPQVPDVGPAVGPSPGAALEKAGKFQWQLTATIAGDPASILSVAAEALRNMGARKVNAEAGAVSARLGGVLPFDWAATEDIRVSVEPRGGASLLVATSKSRQTMGFDYGRNEKALRNLAAQIGIPISN